MVVNSPAIDFKCLAFHELSLQQLYEMMALRQAVFVVEQNCPYVDADGMDQAAYHLLGYHPDGELVAYTRLLPAGTSYEHYASIGRVITRARVRRTGLGKLLMNKSIAAVKQLFNTAKIKISAQCYLIDFYKSFEFEPVGDTYLEDGIPHIAMVYHELKG